jgi:hydroxysqualene synthase
MSEISEFSSGKGHTDENFPVASVLIHPRHRAPILAFYRFVRAADDVADNATAAPEVKLAALEQLRLGLVGEADGPPEAIALRKELEAHGLTDRHALDLLEAFRRDVTKLRYADWYDLVDYCRWSAMPVGRFVLDVHGESRELWPANDALCAALQVINHLQDCGKDYRELDRVYIPEDLLAKNGASVQMLAEPQSPPELARTIRDVARLTMALLDESRPFSSQILDVRLALEVEVIQRLAEDLGRKLLRRDPLCEKVHHTKPEALARAVGIVGAFALSRAMGRRERARASEAQA